MLTRHGRFGVGEMGDLGGEVKGGGLFVHLPCALGVTRCNGLCLKMAQTQDSTSARNQGRSPPDRARPPAGRARLPKLPAEILREGLRSKVPRTDIGAPSRGRALPCVWGVSWATPRKMASLDHPNTSASRPTTTVAKTVYKTGRASTESIAVLSARPRPRVPVCGSEIAMLPVACS